MEGAINSIFFKRREKSGQNTSLIRYVSDTSIRLFLK